MAPEEISYRYTLRRQWSPEVPLHIVMLNPSTADDTLDDPTIRRCRAFAEREGYGGISVCNLFGMRATKPADLKRVIREHGLRAALGPGNGAALAELAKDSMQSADRRGTVLCAWGVNGGIWGRGEETAKLLASFGCTLVCLGTTGGGHPRHPLYVRSDAILAPYSV